MHPESGRSKTVHEAHSEYVYTGDRFTRTVWSKTKQGCADPYPYHAHNMHVPQGGGGRVLSPSIMMNYLPKPELYLRKQQNVLGTPGRDVSMGRRKVTYRTTTGVPYSF